MSRFVPQPDLLTQTLSENVSSYAFLDETWVTLFFVGGIYEEGAVGVALLKDKKAEGVPKQRTDFHGLHKLSDPLTVTRSALQRYLTPSDLVNCSAEGNMINSLNSSNPTQLLLQAIGLKEISSSARNTRHIFKEDKKIALVRRPKEVFYR